MVEIAYTLFFYSNTFSMPTIHNVCKRSAFVLLAFFWFLFTSLRTVIGV